MERALFPDEDTDTDVSGMSSTEKHKYFQEIERIRSELAGFQPIDNPRATESQDPGSPEMAELSKNICWHQRLDTLASQRPLVSEAWNI